MTSIQVLAPRFSDKAFSSDSALVVTIFIETAWSAISWTVVSIAPDAASNCLYGRTSVESAFSEYISECKAYFELLNKLQLKQAVKLDTSTQLKEHDAGFWFQEGFGDWEEVKDDVKRCKNGSGKGNCQFM